MQCQSEGTNQPLRIGIVDYLNSRPRAWSFLQGRSVDGVEARFLSPVKVAEGLESGDLDAGLVPTIALQQIDGLGVIPNLCVAATQEVRSVLLLSKVPPSEIRRLAVDENSRTSVALVNILLQDLYSVEPETVVATPDPVAMLESSDAALIIGDPALRVPRDRIRVLDLAAEWRVLTGKPFVFAVWAVRAGANLGDKLCIFQQSLDRGLDDIESLVSDAAREQGLPESDMREYLTSNLSYRLGQEELSGLHEFFERAFDHGLIADFSPLCFVRSCDSTVYSVE